MEIVVYTLPICPNCDKFKQSLNDHAIPYTTRDLEDDDVRMELLMESVTLVEAPIICIDGTYMNKVDAEKMLYGSS